MNLWKIALRSVQHRRLASGLTALSIGLGVALVVGVMVIHGVVAKTFRKSGEGYDLIIGAKGSRLELVLNTVYHIGKPVGTLPYEYYQEFESGQFAADVELAVPCCMGGNYKGFRVVGTTPDMFDEIPFMRDEEAFKADPVAELASRGGMPDGSSPFQETGAETRENARRLAQGKYVDSKTLFSEGENFGWGNYYHGVVGATVARKTGLKVGDTFRPVHGFDAEQGEEHEEFEVVGVLKPTGNANDRALFINIEGFWAIHSHGHYDEEKPAAEEDGHAHDGEEGHTHAGEDEGDHVHDEAASDDSHQPGEADAHAGHDHPENEDRRVTAILIRTDHKRITRAMALPKIINQQDDAQAAAPAEEVTRLLEGLIGNIQVVLLIFAILIVVVAGIGMMVSIYNSMSERRQEIAIMRALGARRTTVMSIILLESILLSLGGGILGLVLGHGLIGILAPTIMEHTGIVIGALQFQANELILIPGLVTMASIVGYLPAVIAYRTEVAESLSE